MSDLQDPNKSILPQAYRHLCAPLFHTWMFVTSLTFIGSFVSGEQLFLGKSASGEMGQPMPETIIFRGASSALQVAGVKSVDAPRGVGVNYFVQAPGQGSIFPMPSLEITLISFSKNETSPQASEKLKRPYRQEAPAV